MMVAGDVSTAYPIGGRKPYGEGAATPRMGLLASKISGLAF